MIKTVSLTADTETKVEISGGYNVGVINRTTGMLYASRNSGISAGADDVAAIPAGDSYTIRAADDTVYLLATAAGDVQLESIGAKEVFKIAAARSSSGGGEGGGEGGGTVDSVARQAIETHANNEKIHLDEEEAGKIELINNPNLLINPRLTINQRGATEYSALVKIGYCVDGWIARGKSVVTPVDGGLKIACGEESATAHSFVTQTIEDGGRLAGETVTFSVDIVETTAPNGMISVWANDTAVNFAAFTAAGKVVVNADIPADANSVMARIDGARTGAPLGAYSVVSGAKLELGSYATPIAFLDYADELARCQRYYQVRSTGDMDPVDLRPSMAEITDIKQREDGAYEYVAEL